MTSKFVMALWEKFFSFLILLTTQSWISFTVYLINWMFSEFYKIKNYHIVIKGWDSNNILQPQVNWTRKLFLKCYKDCSTIFKHRKKAWNYPKIHNLPANLVISKHYIRRLSTAHKLLAWLWSNYSRILKVQN